MRPQLTNSYVTYIIILLLVLQFMVLATRIAAWSRYRRHAQGLVPEEEPPAAKTKAQALIPVLSSGFVMLALVGGLLANWIVRPAPLTLLLVLAALVVPALLADLVAWVWGQLRGGDEPPEPA